MQMTEAQLKAQYKKGLISEEDVRTWTIHILMQKNMKGKISQKYFEKRVKELLSEKKSRK